MISPLLSGILFLFLFTHSHSSSSQRFAVLSFFFFFSTAVAQVSFARSVGNLSALLLLSAELARFTIINIYLLKCRSSAVFFFKSPVCALVSSALSLTFDTRFPSGNWTADLLRCVLLLCTAKLLLLFPLAENNNRAIGLHFHHHHQHQQQQQPTQTLLYNRWSRWLG